MIHKQFSMQRLIVMWMKLHMQRVQSLLKVAMHGEIKYQ